MNQEKRGLTLRNLSYITKLSTVGNITEQERQTPRHPWVETCMKELEWLLNNWLFHLQVTN
jgi:hypothetical protein